MLTLRKAEERGHANHGWLDSYHSFSFANYYDPAHMGFRSLRVINQDRVRGGMGFGTHPHRDMEIISYVLEGALEHKDSMGNGSIIAPGEVQRLTAGTGITHSEFNHSKTEQVHFLQIWILPDRQNLQPSYEQKNFTVEQKRDRLLLIASNDGRNGSVTVNQDLNLYATVLSNGAEVTHTVKPGRHAWVQVARGEALLNGQPMKAGDGAATSQPGELQLIGKDDAEVLIFDLA
ncbi:pirin family protein [Pseudanabaena sp. PCC 6802]|uniref:pirin family protein n=1 Tax=Pseudanabaena sp. PCC 6802 TaxID=118173 RepID=UPI000348334F|nr:pirin family protein [Pseudanabaena sp. PCC 6802]